MAVARIIIQSNSPSGNSRSAGATRFRAISPQPMRPHFSFRIADLLINRINTIRYIMHLQYYCRSQFASVECGFLPVNPFHGEYPYKPVDFLGIEV